MACHNVSGTRSSVVIAADRAPEQSEQQEPAEARKHALKAVDLQRGSAMGAHYRHTTPEMAARAVDAIQQPLTVVLGVAELTVDSPPTRSTLRVL
jgi:hypothetical protein